MQHKMKAYALALKGATSPYGFFTPDGFQYYVYDKETTAEKERRKLTPSLANDLKVIEVELGWGEEAAS